jgi:FRG domain-containing protein
VQTWAPHSSLVRTLITEREDAVAEIQRRISRFLGWVSITPGLDHLTDDADQLCAIMQHYGIPTHYIDFSMDPGVAGFFAADCTTAPPTGTESCIYCLNSEDLTHFWKNIESIRDDAHCQVVTVDVSNLWRLQAQKGAFLYCDYNWEIDYPMDRIIFPYTGYPSWPTQDMIYPSKKSSLEILLDQYFVVEQQSEASSVMREFIRELEKKTRRKIHHDVKPTPKDGYHRQALKVQTLKQAPGWPENRKSPWLELKDERWDGVAPAPMRVNLAAASDARDAGAKMRYAIARVLNLTPELRRRRIDWIPSGMRMSPGETQGELEHALSSLWNGMRGLPYTDDDIADAFATTVALYVSGIRKAIYNNQMAGQILGECFETEFCPVDGSTSRGYISKDSIRRAARKDLREILRDDIAAGDPKRWLNAIFNPRFLFDFDRFCRVFAREVVPSQVLTRDMVIYSPARLWIFGLP